MNKRMMVQSVAAAEGHDPRHVGLIATDAAGETVELVFPTPEIPGVVSGLLRAAMLAAERLPPEELAAQLAQYLQSSMQNRPRAVDLAITPDQDMLLVNVLSGTLFFELPNSVSEPLKQGRPLRVVGAPGR